MGSIFDAVDKVYKMTVAPAFSDHINDNQHLGMMLLSLDYIDHPVNAQKYLKKNPPYILFDTIKSNYTLV